MVFGIRIKKLALKVAVGFLSLFFVVLVVTILIKGGGGIRSYSSAVKENMLIMNGVKLVYVMDNESYVNLFAKTGFADKDNNSVAMQDVRIEYKGKETKLDAYADNGQYELERLVKVYGNVNGIINDMRFDAGENGTMVYDYKDGKGEVRRGVTLYQGENSINADSVNFDSSEVFVLFQDNVTVDYFVGGR